MKGKIFKTYMLSICFLIFNYLFAAQVFNVPNQLTQPDGTILDVLYSGDEFHNWAHNEDGFTIIQDSKSGYWCWAKAENGDIISTGYAVHLINPQDIGLSPYENISEEKYREKRAFFDNSMLNRNNTRTPSLGVVNNLVVYIRFLGESEFSTPNSYYDQMFNEAGENVNSMYQYFWDASYQQFEVFSHFYPEPIANTIFSYESPNPRSYYQPYNAVSNPNGYSGDNQRRLREHQLLADAIAYIHDYVPADLIIDSDNDNYVDNVCFVVRGGTGAWADLLWPHRWVLYSFDVFLHGKRVWDYNFNIENHMNVSGVSVLAHEFTHSLGAPDFYRYVNQGNPIGMWDLMASNTTPAQSISAFTKYKYTDWITEIPEITLSGYYTLYPNTVSMNNHAYKIPSPNSDTEYFVVEYRSTQTGLTDSALPGSGLLVYRVNTLAGNGNAQGPPDELYVYRPGGTLNFDGTINAAFFSEQSGRTAINDLSNPSAFLSNGNAGGLNISQIGVAGETISFYIDINGADPDDIDESFEDQTFTNFDWIIDENNPWYITSQYAQHGNYSAASADIGHNQTSTLQVTMHVDSGYLQFWYKTSTQTNGDFLKFYINNQEMRAWSGNIDWSHYAIPLNAGVYNFKWVYQKNATGIAGQDKVWIDRIGFPDIIGHILYPPGGLNYSIDSGLLTVNWDNPFQTAMDNAPQLLGFNLFQNGIQVNDEIIENNSFSYYTTGGNLSLTVNAVYNSGESEQSHSMNIPLPFAIPANLSAYSYDNGVDLSWDYDMPTTFLLGFRVYKNGINITTPYLNPDVLTFTDTDVVEGQTYSYFVRAMYINPTGLSDPSNTVEIQYTSNEDTVSPNYINALFNNYPNPFNPETVISFTLKSNDNVKIEIYNVKGERVRTLTNMEYNPGHHNIVWKGLNDFGKPVSSGIYFYKMITSEFQDTKKMLLIK